MQGGGRGERGGRAAAEKCLVAFLMAVRNRVVFLGVGGGVFGKKKKIKLEEKDGRESIWTQSRWMRGGGMLII